MADSRRVLWLHFLRRTRVETGGAATTFSLLAALLPKETTPFAGSFSKPASCDFRVIFLRFEICVVTAGRLTNVCVSGTLGVVEMGSVVSTVVEGSKRRDRLSGVEGAVSVTRSCSSGGVLPEGYRIDLILLV